MVGEDHTPIQILAVLVEISGLVFFLKRRTQTLLGELEGGKSWGMNVIKTCFIHLLSPQRINLKKSESMLPV